MPISIIVLYKGEAYQIELAQTENGACPSHDFLNGLSTKDNVRIIRIIKRLADIGKVYNKEQFKKIEGTDFYEFKFYQIRMPCYFKSGQRVVITNGFIKKQDKYRDSELQRIYKIKEEYEKLLKGK